MDRSNHRNSNIILCPHCNQMMNAKDKYCKSCGYVVSTKKHVNHQQLHFGQKKLSDAKLKEEVNGEGYHQELTKKIIIIRQILNIIFLFMGIVCFFMILLPIFSNDNLYSYTQIISNNYSFKIPELFKLSQSSNFITIIKSIIEYSKINNNILNPSMMFFIYDFVILIAIISLVSIGILSIVLSIRSLFFYKANIYSKKIVGVVLAISLIMIIVLNCYGFGPFFLTLICSSYLIFLYIGGIISKEKPLIVRQLVHKSICCGIIIFILLVSSIGIVNLNIITGANLYNYTSDTSSNMVASSYMRCRGIFVEFMQFVQCSSGDVTFSKVSFLMNVLCLVFHVVSNFLAIFAFVSLLKSLSMQSIKFPVKRIFISTLSFYAFSVSLIIFNKLVNEVSLNNYIAEIGHGVFEQFSNSKKNELRLAYDVFTLSPSFIIAMLFYLPFSIYAIIAKRICLKKAIY